MRAEVVILQKEMFFFAKKSAFLFDKERSAGKEKESENGKKKETEKKEEWNSPCDKGKKVHQFMNWIDYSDFYDLYTPIFWGNIYKV